MPGVEFFARMGLFFMPGFLDRAWCEGLGREASTAPMHDSLLSRGGTLVKDESERKSKRARISKASMSPVESKLVAVMPQVAAHFGLNLSQCQEPQLLRYDSADFFAAHRDNYKEPDAPDYILARQVSTVIFVNPCVESPGPLQYSGGSLTFYGLMQQPGWESYGFRLDSEPGLLVAFPSTTFHEVQPVIAGERFTIVSWYS